MRLESDRVTLSATDLASFFECSHKSVLQLQVAKGEHKRPGTSEIERRMLERRGHNHEAQVLAHFRSRGLKPCELTAADVKDTDRVQATLAAMRRGEKMIYQGALAANGFVGRPDFLIRSDVFERDTPLPSPSVNGAFQYEAVDAKLARTERATAILQLCVYAELLAAAQGALPGRAWLALGDNTGELTELRLEDYLAYYRQSKSALQHFVNGASNTDSVGSYPEPCDHCDICEWWKQCDTRRREDDHLSLVAGITRRQRGKLSGHGIQQLVQLAKLPKTQPIEGIDAAPLARIREQARLQEVGRTSQRAVYELLLESDVGSGLELLPEPRPGDLFLDLEGDAFYANEGLEYLFGLVELGPVGAGDWDARDEPGPPKYLQYWATTRSEEKLAFEAVLTRIRKGLKEFPDLHIFHFGHREADALRKLSCRYAVGEDLIDHLLRSGLLVDLHTVVRQALRASVEAYSLKQLEPLYSFERQVPLRDAARAMQHFGWWLETRDAELDVNEMKQTLARYNEEDCRSTWQLRNWLEGLRRELAQQTGRRLVRPQLPEENKKQTEAARERDLELQALTQKLIGNLPEATPGEPAEYQARRLLVNLLGWHWREQKSDYWEYFEARAVPQSEWAESRYVLSGLEYEGIVGTVKLSELHRYRFQSKDHVIRKTPSPEAPNPSAGENKYKRADVVRIDTDSVDIKRGKKAREEHPAALFPGAPLNLKEQEAQLKKLAAWVGEHGFDNRTRFGAAQDLLLRLPARCGQTTDAPLVSSAEASEAAVARLALALDHSVLAVQGPPGSGKSYCGARAIAALITAGKKVGITANSHSVIIELLTKVCKELAQRGLTPKALHIADPKDFEDQELPFELSKDYPEIAERLKSNELQLVGGTAFAWPREELEDSVDVLFVDEAGQLSLANALAVSAATKSVVLLGDPAQLEQPQKGVHPEGADVSALQHLLGQEHATIAEDVGVFLPITRRLHPDICAFNSQLFYEGRLSSLPGLEKQCITSSSRFSGSGLRFVPVQHAGNTNRSEEEANVVEAIVAQLFAEHACFTDMDGNTRKLGAGGARDVLVVSPYNVQVSLLKQRLAAYPVEVGTVDKFQGKEAPIVIYSLATSSGDDAPRGLEFLYSLNRLNVATSRAKALVVLVANPALTRVKCRTPRQMRLVNALCEYLGRAEWVDGVGFEGAD